MAGQIHNLFFYIEMQRLFDLNKAIKNYIVIQKNFPLLSINLLQII